MALSRAGATRGAERLPLLLGRSKHSRARVEGGCTQVPLCAGICWKFKYPQARASKRKSNDDSGTYVQQATLGAANGADVRARFCRPKLTLNLRQDMFIFELLILAGLPLLFAACVTCLTWGILSRPVVFLVVATVVLYLVYAASMWLWAPHRSVTQSPFDSPARFIAQNHYCYCSRLTRFRLSCFSSLQFRCWQYCCAHFGRSASMRFNLPFERTTFGDRSLSR